MTIDHPPKTDRSAPFRTDHLIDDLKGRSARGGAITLASQGIRFALQLGSTAVLARILTPDDYGLIAMVVAITGLVAMFKEAGLSMATVQRSDITHDQVSTLFWVNVALGIITMAVVMSLAPVVAWFYGDQRLVGITLALSVVFIFSGLSVQHQAILRRQMRFGVLALIDTVTLIVSISVAIGMAVSGLGYWSLVGMSAGGAATSCVLVWYVSGWRPGLPVRGSGVRQLIAFGGYLTGSDFMNYFARNADNVLIGWYWGAGPLGLYSKAYSLLLLPIRQINGPISAVVIPALSRLQNNGPAYRSLYTTALRSLACISMPLVAFCFVGTRELVLLVFGEQWIAVVPTFRILSLAAFLGSVNIVMGWVYVTLGRVRRQLLWSFLSSPVIVVGILIGLPYGIEGVALSYTVAFTLMWFISIPFGTSGTFLKVSDIAIALAPPVSASVLAVAAVYCIPALMLPSSPAASLGIKAIVFACVTALVEARFMHIRGLLNTITRGRRA